MSKASSSKSVLVIGGTGGIGHAIAQFYSDQGCDVVITGRDEERTNAVAKDIGGKTRGIAVDISEPETIEEKLASLGHVDHLALVAVDRDYNSARDYNVQRARKIVTLKLIGTSPDEPGRLPIHLYQATSRSGQGELGDVTYVLRLNAMSKEPDAACPAREVGRGAKADFSADFLFYKPR